MDLTSEIVNDTLAARRFRLLAPLAVLLALVALALAPGIIGPTAFDLVNRAGWSMADLKVPLATARSTWRSSACMSASTDRMIVAVSFMPSAIRSVRGRARLSRQGDAGLRALLSPLAEVDRINDAFSWYFWKFPISTESEKCRGQETKIQVRRCESKTLVHEEVKPCPATSCWRP